MEKDNRDLDLSRGIQVESEIGRLRRIVVHFPDDGVASFPPRLMKDILYDDIVDHENMMIEYSHYKEALYWLLDPSKIRDAVDVLDSDERLSLFKPSSPNYLKSEHVLDVEGMLGSVLEKEENRSRLVSAVGAVERLSLKTQDALLELPSKVLANTLITGILERTLAGGNSESQQIFPPIPNQIFTRDTSVTVGERIFITKPSERVRYRERLIASYVARYYLLPYSEGSERIIDLEGFGPRGYPSSDERLTIEGGDMMMIAPGHLIVGLSNRTNVEAIESLIGDAFEKGYLEKVSVVKIPDRRDYMHIDTVFTQVRRDLWVIFGPFSKMGYLREKKNQLTRAITHEEETLPVSIYQYARKGPRVEGESFSIEVKEFDFLEDFLSDISINELNSRRPASFVYSAGGELLFEEREQWTDSCNFLALGEGLIVGYDRNRKTTAALEKEGFEVIGVQAFNRRVRETVLAGKDPFEAFKGDTLVLLNSYELSRARGGSHCMSQPILRDSLC